MIQRSCLGLLLLLVLFSVQAYVQSSMRVSVQANTNGGADSALCNLYQQRVAEAFYSLSGRWQRARQPLLAIRFVEDVEATQEYCPDRSAPDTNSLLCSEVSRLLLDSPRFLREQWSYHQEGESFVQTPLYGVFLSKQQKHCGISNQLRSFYSITTPSPLYVNQIAVSSYAPSQPLLLQPVKADVSWAPASMPELWSLEDDLSGSWQLVYRQQD